MNTYFKRIAQLLCGTAFITILSVDCQGVGRAEDLFDRSDYYTRGIGKYPGCPAEDFSPTLKPDNETYRNIALHRAAYQSSSHDYNLVAQLVTDGICTNESVRYLTLSTPDGEKPRREQEWAIDFGPYSSNLTEGADTYLQLSLHNYTKKVDRIYMRGSVAYDEAQATEGYAIALLGSKDGKQWTMLGQNSGKELPGKPSRWKVHSDPNKQNEEGNLPQRILEETINLNEADDYCFYRLKLTLNGAVYWRINDLNFFYEDEAVELKPSQYFTSAWMSGGNQEEWIYVDLGSRSTFDKIVLDWEEKALKGKIQTSDNAVKWKDLAQLPGGNKLTDEVSVKGSGRYVRVLMTEAAGDHYVLKEMKVMGKGGLVAHPAAQANGRNSRELILSGGNWTLQRASEVAGSGEDISQPGFETASWITATVPGTVVSSYHNVGALPDPNYADNQLNISESFFWSNFWYRNEFEVPAEFEGEHVFLNFDGINWKANVYLNGQSVGRIEGAFKRGIFDVTSQMVKGKNVLAVEIIRNSHIGAIKEKNKQSTDFNGGILGADNPTFHATIGWDWIPTMRGRNIGIWNDVRLTSSGKVTVSDPLVQTRLPLPDTTSAALRAEVIVKNHEQADVTGLLKGSIGDITFEQPVNLKAGEEKTVAFDAADFAQLNIQHPRLWWPVGYGKPYLYDANFTFVIDGKVSDQRDFKVGIRQMTFNEDNQILNLYINGRRFIGRGGNWGFGESNLNYRGREYETAVAYHADMNFTMMRNWVGMIGDEELYEACDRYGIMIWQDFWLANPADGPDPYDPKMFIDNAEDYVKRIRNHASIGLYCGRNEGFPPEVIDKALRRIVAESHSDLHYIPSSADEVVSGHGPYRMLPAKTYFTMEAGNDKFHSERGMPNVMTYESFLRTFSPERLWPQGDEWGMHDYTLQGAQGATSFNEIIAQGYGEPQDVKEFTELAQWVNYDGHRSMFESRSKHRMGLLMWMSHPCWPSMVWQTYDYYFEPTAAYFGIKKASEPLHIQWNPANEEIEVVNYSAGSHHGLKAKVELYQMDGTLAWEKEAIVDSEEDTTIKPIRMEYPDNISKVHFLKLTLREGEHLVSDNFYHRTLEENNYQELKKLPKVSLKVRFDSEKNDQGEWTATATVKNPSKTPALLIRLNLIGKKDGLQILPVIYGDNYFSLLPGEEKEVHIRWKDVDTRGNQPKLLISGYNVR